MKVTALIPEELVDGVRKYSNGQTLTECLVIALKDWIAIQKIRSLNQRVRKKPLSFRKGFAADKVRKLNRAA